MNSSLKLTLTGARVSRVAKADDINGINQGTSESNEQTTGGTNWEYLVVVLNKTQATTTIVITG